MSSVMKQFEASSHLLRRQRAVRRGALRALPPGPGFRLAGVARAVRRLAGLGQRQGRRPHPGDRGLRGAPPGAAPLAGAPPRWRADDEKQMKVLMFIRAHRTHGLALFATSIRSAHGQACPCRSSSSASYGLGEADLDTVFSMGSFGNRRERTDRCARSSPLVRKTYCGTIGVEYMYLSSMEEKRWLRERFEGTLSTPSLERAPEALPPRAPHRLGGAGALPAHPLRRPEALLAARAARA